MTPNGFDAAVEEGICDETCGIAGHTVVEPSVLADQVSVFRPDQVPIIDVRSTEEYREGHVREAVHIPYEQIADRIKTIVPNRDTHIVLYCRSGRRSGIAEQTLRELGYTHIENKGGLEDMRRAGYGVTE